MRYKLVIFDLDGTLLNTLDDLADSVNELLTRHHFHTHSTDAIRRFVGYGAHNLLKSSLPKEVPGGFEPYMAEFIEIYRTHTEKTALYPGIAELLTNLSTHGVTLSMCTNKPQIAMEDCLSDHLSAWKFVSPIGQRVGKTLKPDPSGVWEILEATGFSREEALFVGDSEVDIRTGLDAGIDTVGVLWGFRSVEDLRREGATCFAHSANDVESLILC